MAVESRVTQEEIKKEPEKPVDREKVIQRTYLSSFDYVLSVSEWFLSRLYAN